MNFSSSYIYRTLNRENIHWVVILLATAVKSFLTAIFSNYEGDKSYYILLGENLGSGHGFTIPVHLLSNPGVTENVYTPSAVSPLYSIIAAPLLKIFPGNYFLVTWLIESACWLILFIVLHRILKILVKENFWCNLFILFAGFFLYNVELSSSSKDVLATALIFVALLQCIQIISGKKKLSTGRLLFTSLLFLLPGLTKFLYLPLAIVFPIGLLFVYFINKEKGLLRTSLWLGVITILLLGAHYFYFHSLETYSFNEHTVFYANRWSLAKSGDDFVAGFYPSNLLQLYPYIPASFLNLDVGGVWVRAVIPSLYKTYGLVLFMLNITGILALAAIFIFISRKYFRKEVSTRIAFFLIGTLLSFSMLMLACALSLRYHSIQYKAGVSAWTYVFENRPFIFSIIFIQLCAFIFLFSRPHRDYFPAKLKIILLILACIWMLHGMYFVAKTIAKPGSAKEKITSINKLVVKDAEKIKKQYPGFNLWIATEMQHLDWYAKLNGHKVLNQVSLLNDSSFNLPPKTILLTAITMEDSTRLSSYASSGKPDSTWDYDNAWKIFLQKSR